MYHRVSCTCMRVYAFSCTLYAIDLNLNIVKVATTRQAVGGPHLCLMFSGLLQPFSIWVPTSFFAAAGACQCVMIL